MIAPNTRSILVRGVLFVVWALSIYLCSIACFASFVPPQGVWASSNWHRFFLVPAIIVSAIGVTLLPKPTGLRGGARSGLVGFFASIVVLAVSCNASQLGDEAKAWYGIPALPIVFFSSAAGALIGASRFR